MTTERASMDSPSIERALLDVERASDECAT